MRPKLLLLAIVATLLFTCFEAYAQSYAITNAKIVTVSGPTIDKGTIVIRGGLIESVGPSVSIPADATVFDASGLTVYPGFIDALTNLGLAAPASPAAGGRQGGAPTTTATAASTPGSNSNYPAGLRPEESAFDELRPGEAQFENARNAGFTTVLTVGRTGIFNGRSVVINLAGENVSQMAVRLPFAEHVTFTTLGGAGYPNSLLGTFSALRQMLYDARRIADWDKKYEADPKGMKRPEADRSLYALIPVVEGSRPIVFNANSEREIVRSLDLIKEFDLKGIIAGGLEAWKVADRLKAQNVSVLLSLNFPKRTTAASAEADPEPLETLRLRAETPKGPARLSAAGVKFAFQSGGLASLGDFFANAGKAVDAGLSREAAIRAMTLGSAEILGVSNRLGSIEAGKIADLTLVKGDLFGRDRFAPQIIIDGKIFEQKEPQRGGGSGRGQTGTSNPVSLNLSGTYSISIEIPGSTIAGNINFTHTGSVLTGTFSTQSGNAQIRDGRVAGSAFSFTAVVPYEGQNIDITVRGSVTGGQISGTIDSSQGSVPFSGSKTP